MVELLQLGIDALNAKAAESGAMKWQPPSLETIREMLPELGITRFIARGGMGAVYEGFQKALGRKVAVKILPPDLNDGRLDFAERFKAEARALANLSHPGIVAIYHAGETAGGLLYFVMELVDGTDLAKLIESEKRLSPVLAIEITSAVCEALSYAHGQGVIHRDIKPSNILIDKLGRVKVTDFGLAKSLDTSQTGLTRSNIAVGTPEFLAPEATIPGCQLDARADIYAVGVMLYQMLAGHLPRGGYKPISSVVKDVNSCYDGIVDKAMQMNREDRYTTATELKTALETAQSRRPWADSAKAFASQIAIRFSGIRHWFTWSFWRQQLSWRFYVVLPLVIIFRPSNEPAGLLAGLLLAICFTAKNLGLMSRFLCLGAVIVAYSLWTFGINHSESAITGSGTTFASSPTQATADRPFINSLGMMFVPIPKTKVLIAVRPTERGVYSKSPTSHPPDWWGLQDKQNDKPIQFVTWDEANQFTSWLSAEEGLHYRMPTVSEWQEAIASDGFVNGNDYLKNTPEAQVETEYRSLTEDPNRTRRKNRLGVYGVSGELREWCMQSHETQDDSTRPMCYADTLSADKVPMWTNSASRKSTCLTDVVDAPARNHGFTFRCVLVIE